MAEPNTPAPPEFDNSIEEAALGIEGILAREDGEQEEPETQPVTPRAKRIAAPDPPETPPEEEPEGEGGEGEPEPEPEPGEGEEAEPMFTVKIDGKEQEVALSELTRGYSGQKWITQRSQALAEERKALEAQAKAVSEERAQYAQYLGQLKKQLETGGQTEPDWEKLKAEDPFNFVVQRQDWLLRQEKLAAIEREQAALAGRQKQEQDAAKGKLIEQENRKVLEAIPSWKDKEKAKAAVAELRAYGREQGWTEEELDEAYDSRAVLALYKAMQFDKLAKAQPARPVNRSPRSARPGSASATPGRPAELTRMKQRLAQTGSVDDAAAIFEQSGVFE